MKTSISAPFLVQRGTIERPMVKPTRLSKAVDLDYMGSSEFEFGALPKSLRALQARVLDIKLTVLEGLDDDQSRKLHVLHTFSPSGMKQYEGFLRLMYEDKLDLKERSRFNKPVTDWDKRMRARSTNPIDFWWDLDNHVMFSYDKVFMNRLGDHLVESWKYMDAMKKGTV